MLIKLKNEREKCNILCMAIKLKYSLKYIGIIIVKDITNEERVKDSEWNHNKENSEDCKIKSEEVMVSRRKLSL